MIFNTTQKQVLQEKLSRLVPAVKFDGTTITIGSKSFIIPKETDRQVSSKTTLSR